MPINLGYLRRFDWLLFGSTVLITAFGLVVIYSTSLAGNNASTPADFSNFWKQATLAGIGALLVLVVSVFNYRMLSGLSRLIFAAAVIMLIAVLAFGTTLHGTTGWIRLGGFNFQPVELIKLVLVIFLAKFFSDFTRDVGSARRILLSGAAFAAVFGLVLAQPDLGSAILLFIVWVVMLLVSGVRRSHVLVMAVVGILAVALASTFVLKPYQKDRIANFWDNSRDPQGSGWNVSQSVIAVGSGGLLGKGLGFGSQSQLRFLPERQTDFIFSVVAEELGLLGVIMLCVLFGTFFFRAWMRAVRAKDDFTLFLALGIIVSMAAEVFVNIGGALRLLPMTGVTLPFVSYGGSSLLMKYLMVGVLEAIAVRE